MSRIRETRDRPKVLGAWPSGVDNVHDIRELQSRTTNGFPQAALRAAVNVDLTPEGRPRLRKGYEQRAAGYAHSLWSPDSAKFAFLVKDSVLSRMTLNGDTEVLDEIGTVHATRRMVYAEIAGRVFGSNGLARWSYEDGLRPWGVEAPGLPTVAPAGFGGLDAGTYKVIVTFIDRSGEESGCRESATVTLTEGQGIALSLIPQPSSADVLTVRLYVSRPNGDVMYACRDLPVGISSYVLARADVTDTGKPLETQFCERVPACKILFAFRGRLYFAIGSRLFYTLPLRYGLYKPSETYLPMPHPITDAVATNEAIYVGTERETVRLAGDDPKAMERRSVDGYGMVAGTATRLVRGDDVSAVWWSKNGVLFRAGSDGVTALTRNRIALPEFQFGAVLHREMDGFSQIVSTLRGAGARNSFTARDRFDAQVVRNGVVIK